MKRYWVFIALAALAVLPSCLKGEAMNEEDYIGGKEGYSNRRARTYMMSLADDLVAGMLDEMELALEVDNRGTGKSAHFEMGGSLTTVGSVWRVKAEDSAFKDLSIRCTGEGRWALSYSGDFALVSEENLYPTDVNMVASRYLDAETQAEGWTLSLSGQREERLDYSCSFKTTSLQYINTRGAAAPGWNQMFGDLDMYVYKNGAEVEICCLSFEGAPSQATFIRGL